MSKYKLLLSISFLASILTGCASNPTISADGGLEQFAADISGKEYNFLISDPAPYKSISGMPDKTYGLIGLRVALKPLAELCQKEGGRLRSAKREEFSNVKLPTEFNCTKNDQVIWGLAPGYTRHYQQYLTMNRTTWFFVTLNAKTYSQEEYARKARAEWSEARRKAEEEKERLRQLALEKERLEEAARQWRKTIKTGDIVEWPIQRLEGPIEPKDYRDFIAIGRAVEVEDALVLVQFENLKFGDGYTRHVPKQELYPYSGKADKTVLQY